MTTWKPGAKGAYLTLVSDVVNWLHEVAEDLWNVYGDEGDDLQDAGKGSEILRNLHGSAPHWNEEKDAFGHKMYKELDFGDQKYRITVIVKKDGQMKLDIRSWYKED